MLRLVCALIGFTSVAMAADVSGTWQFTVERSQGAGSQRVVLRQMGEELRATFTSQAPGGVTAIGSVKGNAIEFGFTMETGGPPIKINYKGTVDSPTSMKGTAIYPGFDDQAAWSATRLDAAKATSPADRAGRAEPDRGPENARVAGQPTQGRASATPVDQPHQLFLGVNGTVLAVDRTSGQELWRSRLKGGDFVNVVLNGGDLFAATHGELYCLDIATGHVRWHTPLKKLGRGLVTIAGNQQTVVLQAKRQQQEGAADAGMLILAAGL